MKRRWPLSKWAKKPCAGGAMAHTVSRHIAAPVRRIPRLIRSAPSDMALVIEKRVHNDNDGGDDDGAKKNGKKGGKRESSKSDGKAKEKGQSSGADFDYYVHYLECERAEHVWCTRVTQGLLALPFFSCSQQALRRVGHIRPL